VDVEGDLVGGDTDSGNSKYLERNLSMSVSLRPQ